MTPPTFELNYDLTADDLQAWKNYAYANLVSRSQALDKVVRSRAFNLLAVVLGSIIGLAVVGTIRLAVWAAGLTWEPYQYWLYFFGVIAGIVVTVLVFRSKGSAFRRKLLAKLAQQETRETDKQLLGRRTLTVSAEGFQLESPNGITTRKWSISKDVYATDSHVFIVADVAVVVPRSAFTNDTQRNEFIAAIESWNQQP